MSSKTERQIMDDFWDKQAEEAREEVAMSGENDYLDPYHLVEFVSESNGKGRKKRNRPREIILIKSASGHTYSVKNDVPNSLLDRTAELAAGAEYRDGLTAWEWFINRLRNRPQIKRKK